jgi:hypothetical protein
MSQGTEDEEQMLARLVRRWIDEDDTIVTSLRSEFGMSGGTGSKMFDHVKAHFIDPIVNEGSDAEADLLKFNWPKAFDGDGMKLKKELDKFWAIVARLPQGRTGDATYWVKYVKDRTPTSLVLEYHRHIIEQTTNVQQQAANDTRVFAAHLCKARNTEQRRIALFDPEKEFRPPSNEMQFNQHMNATTRSRTSCKDCTLVWCPHAVSPSAECDVHGTPTEYRLQKMTKFPNHQARVDVERKRVGKTALMYPSKKEVEESQNETTPKGANSYAFDETLEAMIDRLEANGEISNM